MLTTENKIRAINSLRPGAAFSIDNETATVMWLDQVQSEPSQAEIDAWIEAPKPVEVPRIISDRQFFQQLAIMGVITPDEALTAVGPGTLPSSLAALVDALPEDSKFAAKMLLVGATQFDRSNAMVSVIGAAFGWTTEQIDNLWIEASKL